MKPEIFDDTPCALGEGPLWHPERKQLFWFDILGRKLHSRTDEKHKSWEFDTHVSAAGWIDNNQLLVADQNSLFLFNLETSNIDTVCSLEAGRPWTRSNDGRVDPFGGFWIGTIGLQGEAEAGAIYRYYKGELRLLYPNMTVPNSICFTPDGLYAYFTDTGIGTIWKQRLEQSDGWPEGEPVPFVDCAKRDVFPDGSVVDNEGRLWNAEYGSGNVTCYTPEGLILRSISFPTINMTCPAFGGETFGDLYVTSAMQGFTEDQLAEQPAAGNTFLVRDVAIGQPEHRVTL
ncbi:MAG: SMP-30/gluconolactonase/LRE family protein [Hyphomicrobiales bacterium]|nr:SMP-30/gluconolactonase/LRE family protein [Hyphomicrobiales bacterium]